MLHPLITTKVGATREYLLIYFHLLNSDEFCFTSISELIIDVQVTLRVLARRVVDRNNCWPIAGWRVFNTETVWVEF